MVVATATDIEPSVHGQAILFRLVADVDDVFAIGTDDVERPVNQADSSDDGCRGCSDGLGAVTVGDDYRYGELSTAGVIMPATWL